ncbi:aldo/keto reductase [Hyalangium sp.]|uniref:aldo/keto reductase n=1 Tax=Hyalangium sp. TaxID=2028555 RepID=UPI002D66A63E|nr:aldo/keto reductase [Hyalangium sp.]HYH97146.1 aldo/keto reductase [Hyalangium sp.]
MQKRQLGKSDLQLTPIGFGAWAIGGGGWAYAWGPQDDQQSIRSIQRALDLGINWIDTAAVYGLGHSEEVVARALEGRSNRPYLFTKCALVWDANGQVRNELGAASIRRECEESLRRLKVDTLDLYQIHWPLQGDSLEGIEEGWTAMAELQRQGKVRWIGVSNFNVKQMELAHRIAPITSLQPPYSLLHRGIEKEILPFCERQGIGVIGYSPMASGLLTGAMTRERVAAFPEDDWRRRSTDFQEPNLSRNLALVELLRRIGARHGRSPGEVAIAWTLRLSAVTAAIVGARSAEQVDGFIGAMDFRLSLDEVQEIEDFFRQQPSTGGEAHV